MKRIKNAGEFKNASQTYTIKNGVITVSQSVKTASKNVGVLSCVKVAKLLNESMMADSRVLASRAPLNSKNATVYPANDIRTGADGFEIEAALEMIVTDPFQQYIVKALQSLGYEEV